LNTLKRVDINSLKEMLALVENGPLPTKAFVST
jgi:hypothetical protein